MNQEVARILSEALECLDDAQIMLNNGRYKATVSRSYYAMYHTAKAALMQQGIESYTHQGVNSQFAKHFIKTGIFDKNALVTFSKMLDKRLKSDYEVGFKANEDDANFALSEAKKFYSQIVDYLNNN